MDNIILDYNIFLELAVIPLDIILCLFLFIRFTNRTQVNKAYKFFAFAVTIANITDIVTAIITSMHAGVPNTVHYLFNILDSCLAALAGFSFIYYIYAFVKMSASHYRIRNMINCSLLLLDFTLLITNPITHLVFVYDEAGNYIHNVLFVPVAYGFPILFFFIGCGYMLTHWKNYKKSQIIIAIISIAIVGLVFLLQMLFFDTFLITFYVASLGLLIIFLSLETPDYERLIITMKELHESQASEAASRAKARLSQEVILALSKAVDAKDHYTNGHSARVARYAQEIARRMGKTEKEQEEIFTMGLLHDVGKIGVDEIILNKTGKLTDDEFDIIKSHTTTGYNILKTITEIPSLSTGAKWHHERYDGTGYPDGKKGSEIPEEARIICVADAYDAMTSKRSYSNPKSRLEVRNEILRCKGTQFDPDIADVMIRIIDEDTEFKLKEYLKE